MRVTFFGTATFAVPSLEELVAHRHAVELCVTQPDRPRGRGLKPEPSPVKQAASRLGLPLSQPERLRAKVFEGLHPEVGVAAAYGQLIGPDVLAVPTQGIVGVHPSLLPKYRGAAPVAWAILEGMTMTGVTVFRLDERLDAGDIVSQRAVAIEPGENTQQLTERLAVLGAQELLRALDAIEAGRATFTPQHEAHASVAPKLSKAQGRIDWSQTAEAIERLVRATIPWPGATTAWRGKPLRVWSASSAASTEAAPGTVVQVQPEGLTIATGSGTLLIRELQPPGRRRMPVRAFLAGHPIQPGDRFGDDA